MGVPSTQHVAMLGAPCGALGTPPFLNSAHWETPEVVPANFFLRRGYPLIMCPPILLNAQCESFANSAHGVARNGLGPLMLARLPLACACFVFFRTCFLTVSFLFFEKLWLFFVNF